MRALWGERSKFRGCRGTSTPLSQQGKELDCFRRAASKQALTAGADGAIGQLIFGFPCRDAQSTEQVVAEASGIRCPHERLFTPARCSPHRDPIRAGQARVGPGGNQSLRGSRNTLTDKPLEPQQHGQGAYDRMAGVSGVQHFAIVLMTWPP